MSGASTRGGIERFNIVANLASLIGLHPMAAAPVYSVDDDSRIGAIMQIPTAEGASYVD